MKRQYQSRSKRKIILILKIKTFRFEAKRLEIEAWFTRMENRSERMGVVASTADVLEAQQKEQKVINKFAICYLKSLFKKQLKRKLAKYLTRIYKHIHII